MNAFNLVNTDLSLSCSADLGVEGFIEYLRDNGLKAGKKPVAEFLAGGRDEICGFYRVEVEAAEVVGEVAKASAADVMPDFSEAAIAAAIASSTVEVITGRVAAVATPGATRAPSTRAKAGLKASSPVGKIKPVRANSKIADGLVMLLAGTSEAALLAAGVSDDIADFVNRRVTKRGYGVSIVDGFMKLVLPAGATDIVYSGVAPAVVVAPVAETV